MQTRKKISAKYVVSENEGSKPARQQKKMNPPAEKKKVSELITSSARKQRPDSKNMTDSSPMSDDDSPEILSTNGSADAKRLDESDPQCVLDTLFSPKYYLPHDEQGSVMAVANAEADGRTLATLSPEVSAIYMAMQHSKLECHDEQSHDPMAADGMDAEEYDDFDDFNPYVFIKNLPELSAVVPSFRPMLLPKQTRSCPSVTLVLDLDETLVHSTLEPCGDADFTFPVKFNQREHRIYVRCRPHLREFLERVSSLFEIIVFTASQGIYAEQLLNVLDPKRRLFRHRVFRESCLYVEGNYVKDLSVLGRDLARVVIVDNSPQAFGFQVDNGIPIESWFDDRADRELLYLLPFLESLVDVDDVRPLIASKFNLREKIASAT